MFVIVGELWGVFRNGRPRQVDYDVLLVTAAWTIGAWGTLSAFKMLGLSDWTVAPYVMVIWFLLVLLSILLIHLSVRGAITWIEERSWEFRRCAVIGTTPLAGELAKSASRSDEFGMNIAGVFTQHSSQEPSVDAENSDQRDVTQVANNFQAMIKAIERREIDTVFIAEPMENNVRIREWIDRLADTTASVYLVPNLEAFDVLYSRWGAVGGHTVVSVFETPIFGIDGYLKRGMDILLSSIGLAVAAPLLFLIALAIRLTSEGPVFFRQRRYGLDGQEFLVWKFRTMSTMEDGRVVKQATKNDPRVTPVGRLLRRTSLDELPQLFNVLGGSMSLVGPRPYATAHNEHFRSLIRGYMLRHKVRPGITGLAQVLGSRLETDTTEKMAARIELDHRYIRDWSLWLDLKIMLKTIAVVLRQQAH
jgi:putative colanic acid biosynthesis UDP-glucose lipid carrier transferase